MAGYGIARRDGVDQVASPDGSGHCCAEPSTQTTWEGSDNVFVNGIGIVREGDAMITHNYDGPCCVPHAPVLDTFSGTVYCNGKRVGRVGDAYGGDHIIITGSTNVIVGS